MSKSYEDKIKALPKEALAMIALYAFGGLYLDMKSTEGIVREFVNPDKQVSGADYVQHMAGILDLYGLTPE